MKGLLLRIGIDRGAGGCLAPIFQDGTFEYIPIPEERPTSEKRTFSNLSGRYFKSFTNFIPKKLCNLFPHFDPEFETFTYGDPTQPKSAQLLKLVPGDLLVFYAGLRPEDGIDKDRLYIIGYFKIRAIYDFDNISESEYESTIKKLRNNAHIKMIKQDKGLVVAEGNTSSSKLLTRALPLGDNQNHVLQDLESTFGYKGSILRAVGHWINEDHIQKTWNYLNNGVPILIDDETSLYSYVLKSDTGFAPNITGDWCTLACCKPKIGKNAQVGDWIMGTLPKEHGKNKLAYLMRINETLTFTEYFNDDRFQIKKPKLDPNGDNIYYRKNNRFIQIRNNHHKEKDLKHDAQTDRVLISSLFWYFGKDAIDIPLRFQNLIRTGPGHRKENTNSLIRKCLSWISSKYRPGIHGNPRDNMETKEKKFFK